MIFRNSFMESNNMNSIDVADERLLEWLGIDSNSVNVRDKNSLKEATVFACIKILTESIAKLPLKIYQNNSGIKKATDHYLYGLLKNRPNRFMSTFNFFTALEAQRNIHGNAYASIEYNKFGKIVGLWPMDSSNVEIWIDNKGILSKDNSLWYLVTLDNGSRIKLQPSEVLHFKGFTLDGISGITPITYLRSLVENGKSAQDYMNNFFKNGLQTKGIINYVGDLDSEAENRFRAKFEKMSSGLKNAHRVSLLPLGYQFQPLSLSMADAQFLENSNLTIRQIASAFGIKMHQLNDLTTSTYANISEQQRQFYIDTLMAILTMYEQELTYKLFLDSEIEKGFYCKFNVDAIVRADIKTRYEAYRIGIQGGFLKPNEVRSSEEYEAAEGGDTLLVNGNMVPIEEAGIAYKRGKGGD